MTLALATCANHPAREALGVCVHCRRLVCGECTTRIDGVNHCVDCLAARAVREASPEARAFASGRLDAVLVGLGALAFVVLVRLLLELAWGGGA